jgi:two-component system sensor histidine kinase HydH
MNLLKQTALILGLASLSLGSWTLVRDWRNKISILFSLVCFVVAVWSLSFVSHVTLFGRLSYDIHLFCNILLVPLAIELISRIFLKEKDSVSSGLSLVSMVGTSLLGFLILFSLGSGDLFRNLLLFWPTLILILFFHVIRLEFFHPARLKVDSISLLRKIILYSGLGLTLSLCTFDHIRNYGYTLPAIGNLLFTLYLFFANQVIVPEKLPGLEALASRFLAVLTLSLVITGFFALLYSYISATFPLFLLNSFLISFAVLALWGPLLTFFRYLTRQVFSSSRSDQLEKLERFKAQSEALTDQNSLFAAAKSFAKSALGFGRLDLELLPQDAVLPASVAAHFRNVDSQKQVPFLYRGFLEQERDQVLTQDRKRELELQLEYLRTLDCDLLSVIRVDEERALQVRIRESATRSAGAFPGFNRILEFIHHLAGQAARVGQIERAREKDRLVLLGEMAAGLAHEIRNPLGAIRGAVNLIEPDPGPWGRVIREEVDRLNSLVSQFLDFSRSQEDKRERVNLGELVPKIVKQIEAGISPSIRVEVKSNPGECLVWGVPDSIRQVISNLVQNSVKALEGAPEPLIQVNILENGFEVCDNGIGMNEETISKVFQPFFTSFKEGSGLGLSICEKLIRADQGRISIRSGSGKGTEVSVEYPDAR